MSYMDYERWKKDQSYHQGLAERAANKTDGKAKELTKNGWMAKFGIDNFFIGLMVCLLGSIVLAAIYIFIRVFVV